MIARLSKAGLAASAIAIAASCADSPPPATRAQEAGYTAGCVTGFSDAGKPGFEGVFSRDEKRYASDPDYQRGWNEGEKRCYAEEMNFPSMSGFADHGVFRGP